MRIKTNKDALRKAFSLKVRAILFFGVGFFSCEAQSGLSIPFLNTTPAIDGDLKEWPSSPTVSFSMANQQVPLRNHADIWLGFDENHLYGAFSLQDRRLVQTEYGNGNPRLWLNDAVELYLDAKNDSHDFMDSNDFQLIMDAFGQVVVFRGGDKYQLKITRSLVPKDTITNSFVLDCKAVRQGTVNNNEDTDVGYVVEFRIPWVSLGIQPQAEYRFKIDLCLDDLDTLFTFAHLPAGTPITHLSFQSVGGLSDYGFPQNWQTATLHGAPSVWYRFKKLRYWPLITLSVLTVLLFLLVWLGMRNRKLRDMPHKAENDTPLALFFDHEPLPPSALPHQPLFLQAREVVLQHLGQDLSPTALAAQLFMGLRQLQRIFKEELQTTPNAFIVAIKMEEAARLLTAGGASVAEVAYALGFTDPAYFARVFRKYFGCTPTAFAERKGMSG